MADPDYVWNTVNKIIDEREKWSKSINHIGLSLEEFGKEMSIIYEQLLNDSPGIFLMTIEGRMDLEKLKYMLDMSRNINNGKSTFEDASKSVGDKFAKEYVNPILEKLNNEK
jgi:hypothetical protein